jgi:hypothetical protein
MDSSLFFRVLVIAINAHPLLLFISIFNLLCLDLVQTILAVKFFTKLALSGVDESQVFADAALA